MFLATAFAYLMCALAVWRWLPSLPLPKMDADVERVSSWRDPAVRALFFASTLMWACNSMYRINMPLYITCELGLDEMLAGAGFYSCLVIFTDQYALIALQLFNAIFIGIVAGIGMSYFQDLMPGRVGVATTLLANSIRTGSIMAGTITGVVAEWWSFHGVFMVALALALALLALATCWRVPDV